MQEETNVATVKVMSAGAVQSMVTALGAEFERASGNTLDLNFNTAGALRERFSKGEHPDLLILPAAIMEALDKEGAFVPGTRVALGRTVTGVTVKDGAALPDISTPDAFKQALLKAGTVAYTDPQAGGSSGTFFAGLLQRLGIADAINKKAVLGKRGVDVAQSVAEGRAEIGSTFISEILTVPGAKVVGALPKELDNANTYTAAIPADAKAREQALSLLRTLTEPSSRPRWTAAGLEPAFP
jgi:molybdate transport system substrate-binding protein